jgi:hypothetical protein
MWSELTGCVPKLPPDYAKTLIQRAYRDVRRKNLWSFQLFDANWTSPPIINQGLVTCVQGTNTVVFDATASALITAAVMGPPTPITQRQFRVGIGTIYNIWAYSVSSGIVTLTLDRNYQESSVSGSGFMIFQCYYPAPMEDFLTFTSVRDTVNFIDLFINRKTRAQIDEDDPQRTWYYFPTDVVGYQADQNLASPTYRWPMFELWGAPLYQLTYQLYGIRRGVPLANNSDVLPPAIGEDCVVALGRKYAYEWAEANKGDLPRNAGPDFRFLITQADKEYQTLYREYRKDDMETINNYFAIMRSGLYGKTFAYYNAISGTAFPGLMM